MEKDQFVEKLYFNDVAELRKRDQELLNMIAEVNMKLHAFKSLCREFEKQRFNPVRDMVRLLEKAIGLREDKTPVCPRCAGKGYTWK